MIETSTRAASLRQRCGRTYTLVRDHVLGITRTGMFEVSCDCRPAPASRPLATFRLGGPADLHGFTEHEYEYGKVEKQFGFECLERGDSLIIGECEGVAVFYIWLMYGEIDLDQGVRIPTMKDVAYCYRAFTLRGARGLGICEHSYGYIKRVLQERGHNRITCRIDPGNTASLRAHYRAGFRQHGLLWKVVLPCDVLYYADKPLRSWMPTATTEEAFSRLGFLQKAKSRRVT